MYEQAALAEGTPARQSARVRGAPQPPAGAPRGQPRRAGLDVQAPRAERLTHRRSRRRTAGAHRDAAARGGCRSPRQRLRGRLPSASALWRHAGQQGRVHRGACVRAVAVLPPSVSTSAASARARAVYDEGRGETRGCARGDRLRAPRAGRRRRCGSPASPSAARWRCRRPPRRSPQRLVLVAPGITTIDITRAPPPQCPWLIVQGDADEVVPADCVLGWAAHGSSRRRRSRCCPGRGTSSTGASTSCATRCSASCQPEIRGLPNSHKQQGPAGSVPRPGLACA